MLSHSSHSAILTMGKRSCPFDFDHRPQMKIHVSDKEVACGVSRNERMKLVYDKTLSLLFQGAKNTPAETPSAETSSPVNVLEIKEIGIRGSVTVPQNSMKQMVLTSSCQLQLGEKSVIPSAALMHCSACHVTKSKDISMCAFCDKALCATCTVSCKQCHNSFCNVCTFEVYDNGGSHVCKNCM